MITIVEPTWRWSDFSNSTFPDITKHLEECGRKCYRSEDRITEGSAEKFVEKICRIQHESVLEHATLTAFIQCSRACSHQLVRHRLAAYSQESMRFCNYGKRGLQVICPPSIGIEPGRYYATTSRMPSLIPLNTRQRYWVSNREQVYQEYLELLDVGVPPEDARFSLPIATKTELAVTLNLRMWRHVIRDRALNPKAQWEIRGIFNGIYESLKEKLPAVFGDLVPLTKEES
jgi:thymidylate synthase (FAD)